MHSKVKFRSAPFILASLFFLNSLGIYLFAYSYIGIHRMTAGFDKREHKVILVLNKNEWRSLQWIGKRDFVFSGKVYDLHSVKKCGDKVQLTCENDKEETFICNNIRTKQAKDAPLSISSIYKSVPLTDEMVSSLHHIHLFSAGNIYSPYPVQKTADAFTELILPPRIG